MGHTPGRALLAATREAQSDNSRSLDDIIGACTMPWVMRLASGKIPNRV
jgi:hypothetical protein